jgi:hypothetical protein
MYAVEGRSVAEIAKATNSNYAFVYGVVSKMDEFRDRGAAGLLGSAETIVDSDEGGQGNPALHEAIEMVLRGSWPGVTAAEAVDMALGRREGLSVKTIARILNEEGLYTTKSGQPVTADQICMRVKSHLDRFDVRIRPAD